MAAASAPTIEIACATDRAFLPHAATMLASLLANGGTAPRVHLLAGEGIGRRERRRIGEVLAGSGVELTVHRMDDGRFEGFRAAGPFPVAVWYRTLLPELLAESPRVLYLDSDLLVLDELGPLWDTDLRGAELGAIRNAFPDRELADRHPRSLGLDPRRYFNSGVLLMDLERMRADHAFERVRDFALANAGSLVFPDQDTLNGAFAYSCRLLDPRWNLQLGAELHPEELPADERAAIEAASADPAIRHFEGAVNKPWRQSAPPGVRELWSTYRALTPWGRAETASR